MKLVENYTVQASAALWNAGIEMANQWIRAGGSAVVMDDEIILIPSRREEDREFLERYI